MNFSTLKSQNEKGVKRIAKSKWEQVKEKLQNVETWASMGLSDVQIAFNLGISKDTFYRYKKDHTDFSDSLKRGKVVADTKVENSLYKKATGYSTTEQMAIKVKEESYTTEGKKIVNEKVEVVEVIKEIQPDVAAIKFWLVNRTSDRWTDNPHKNRIDRENLKLRKKEVDSKAW